MDFHVARTEHAIVKDLAVINAGLAEVLWDGITGQQIKTGTVGEAMRDTVPSRFAARVAMDEIAAAFAFGLAVNAFDLRTGQAPNQEPHTMRATARGVWERFTSQADAAEELVRGFGWDDSLAWESMRQTKIAQVDLSKVRRVARLAGRMYLALRGKHARRVPGTGGEIYSVEFGDCVERLLPAELALLDEGGLLELVGLHRLATRQAMQFAVRGEAPCSKGPLVVAIDESDSMMGSRDEWAKAAAVAISRIATEDGRPVAVVHWSTSVKHQRLNGNDPASVTEMIQRFLTGGTCAGMALGVAGKQVQELARQGDHGADVILITDGLSGDIEAQTEALDELDNSNVRLWTVAIEIKLEKSSHLRSRAAGYSELDKTAMNDADSVLAMADAV